MGRFKVVQMKSRYTVAEPQTRHNHIQCLDQCLGKWQAVAAILAQATLAQATCEHDILTTQNMVEFFRGTIYVVAADASFPHGGCSIQGYAAAGAHSRSYLTVP